MSVKRTFTASIARDGAWYVAQSLDVGLASRGETEASALANLGEALALYFAPPMAAPLPVRHQIEVEVAGINEEARHGTVVDHGEGARNRDRGRG